MKKSALLVVIVVAALLSGCTSTADPDSSLSPTGPSATVPTPSNTPSEPTDDAITPVDPSDPTDEATVPPPYDAPTPANAVVKDWAAALPGDCFNVQELASGAAELHFFSCEEVHTAEVYAIVPIKVTDFPGTEDLDSMALSNCYIPLGEYLNPAVSEVINLKYNWITPSEEVWNANPLSRNFTCFATEAYESGLTGSIAG